MLSASTRRSRPSELDSLDLGARIVSEGDVTNSVIRRRETQRGLQEKQAALNKIEKDIARLERARKSLSKNASSDSAEIGERAERLRSALAEACRRQKQLKGELLDLRTASTKDAATGLLQEFVGESFPSLVAHEPETELPDSRRSCTAGAGTEVSKEFVAASPAPVESVPRWGRLKCVNEAMSLNLDDEEPVPDLGRELKRTKSCEESVADLGRKLKRRKSDQESVSDLGRKLKRRTSLAARSVKKAKLQSVSAKEWLSKFKTEVKEEVGTKKESTPYHVDASQLARKGSMARWKQTHAEEWRALQKKRESADVVKRPGALKRVEKGERRGDDTSEIAYNKRQLQETTNLAAAAALRSKNKVEQDAGEEDVDVDVGDGLSAPKWIWDALYDYQHTCVRWLWSLHRQRMGGILADEMGLGKTIMIAAYLASLHHSGVLQSMRVQNTSLGAASPPSPGGVLICCPATLISQWKSELNVWFPPLRVCVMHQVDDRERKESIRVASSNHGVLVTSYETMRTAIEDLLETSWVLIILDEGQKIRNPHASITLAVKRFSTPHRLILSGSPIQNNLQELWSLFDFICPGRLGTLPVFLEEFGRTIELGNQTGANETRVAAAFQCATALRELTMPCILRRTKAEVMDCLQLPQKQEQVLFCNLSAEQYQVYVDFLQTEKARKAMSATHDGRAAGAAFFAISVIRKLCNHPDLLLPEKDHPEDVWNVERSGKMVVLAKIMRLWQKEGHRTLVFTQTIQQLDVLQAWMRKDGYAHLRIDGKTPVKQRLKLIDQFNANTQYVAMILTTRVGGVGLNIIGADRVVIFDPDWNPMTDVQARERAWRIGQKRDVVVYRLVLTGTIEEKIYQRQVYKHFLSQKVLNDPRQRQFMKWSDLADLFDVPPAPPNFKRKEMEKLRSKYKALLANMDDEGDENPETTDVFKAIAALPAPAQSVPSKESAAENNAILQSLFDSDGIKASFDHDKVEQPLLDRKIVREGASMIAKRAIAALKQSIVDQEKNQRNGVFKGKGLKAVKRDVVEPPRAPSADILEGLKQLAQLRADPAVPGAAVGKGELLKSDKGIAEQILNAFLDPKAVRQGHALSTGQVLQLLARGVAAHHVDTFKSLLKEMCTLSKAEQLGQESVWTLKKEFRSSRT